MVVTVMVIDVSVSHVGNALHHARASMLEPAVGVRLARVNLDAQHLPPRHAEHGLGEQQQHGGELDGPGSHRKKGSVGAC